MKEKRIELTHDIIAEKIWQRLPEQDKRLRQIKKALVERQASYLQGNGSLLGYKEVQAWESYLERIVWEKEEQKTDIVEYFKLSEAKIAADEEIKRQQMEREKAQIEKNRRLQRRIWTSLGIATLVVGSLIGWASERNKTAIASEEKAILAIEKATQDSINAAEQNFKAEQATILAQQTTLKAQTDSARAELDRLIIEGKITEANERIEELNLKTANNLANQAFIALEEDNSRLALRLSQAALDFDQSNVLAKNVLDSLPYYLGITFSDIILEGWSISPDTNYFVIFRYTDELILELYDIKKERKLKTFKNFGIKRSDFGNFDLNQIYKFSSDGKYFALVRNFTNPTVELFNLRYENSIKTFRNIIRSDLQNFQYSYSNSFRFSHKGRYLIVLQKNSNNPSLTLFDIKKMEIIHSFDKIQRSKSDLVENETFLDENDYGLGLEYSYEKSFMLSMDESYISILVNDDDISILKIIDLETGTLVKIFNDIAKSHCSLKDYNYYGSYFYSPDSRYLSIIRNQDNPVLELFDLKTNSNYHSFKGLFSSNENESEEGNYFHRFSPKGKYLLVQSSENSLESIFSIGRREKIITYEYTDADPDFYSSPFPIQERFILLQKVDQSILRLIDLNDSVNPQFFENTFGRYYTYTTNRNGLHMKYSTTHRLSPNEEFLGVLNNSDLPKLDLFDIKRKSIVYSFTDIISHENLYYTYSPKGTFLFTHRRQSHDSIFLEIFSFQTNKSIYSFDKNDTAHKFNKNSLYPNYDLSISEKYFSIIRFMNSPIIEIYDLERQIKLFTVEASVISYGHLASYYHSGHFSSNEKHWILNKGSSVFIYNFPNMSNQRIVKHKNMNVIMSGMINSYLFTYGNNPSHLEIDSRVNLKITNPNIPQDQVINYYDEILPPLSEAEKKQYGIVY